MGLSLGKQEEILGTGETREDMSITNLPEAGIEDISVGREVALKEEEKKVP